MLHIRSRNGNDTSSQDDTRADGRKRSAGRKGRNKLFLLIVLVIIASAMIIGVAFTNTSVGGSEIKKGDNLQYSIEGYESGRNVTGALEIEVTSASSNSFKVNYKITLNGDTTSTDVTLNSVSGGWSENAGDVVSALSGSSNSATPGNTTTYYTLFGQKDLTGYTITTTTKSGEGVFFEYWLDTTTHCPYVMAMTYQNGDTLTFTLVYTSISDFDS